MSKRYFVLRCSVFIISMVIVLGFFNLGQAAPPKIDSITPDMGKNNVPTQVTIDGSGFQAIPKVALYGGGPYKIGACDTPTDAVGIYVAGTCAYVADGVSGLQVIDISDPNNPSIVGSCDTPGIARNVYVAGTYAYVADGSFLDFEMWYEYESSLQVIDISDPENPRIVGSCHTPGSAQGIYVTGTYAYVADYHSGLQVIDISDPKNPSIVGSFGTLGDAKDVYVTGTYAYLADRWSGLQVIDISNPKNPSIVGSCDTPGHASSVYVTGAYAYVAGYDSGLQIIDISDPNNPSIVGSWDTPDYACDVYIIGTYAYVADWYSGLQVMDISNPKNPRILGSCDTPGSAISIYVTGTQAYVVDYNSGLQVIDISNPKNPGIVGSCDTPNLAIGIYVTDKYAFVADWYSGLQVIEKFKSLTDITYLDSNTITATVSAGYRPGTYNLHVTNPDGGHAVRHNAFTSVQDAVEVTMELPAGWSMIALPVRPAVATITALLPGAVVVYKYEKGTGYVRVEAGENLEVGMGYWILFHSLQSYTIKGTEIIEHTMPVQNGWYMIGGCSMPAQKMLTNGKIDVIYGYTQGVGYKRVLGSEPLKPGKGYWILFSNTSEGAEFTASTSAVK